MNDADCRTETQRHGPLADGQRVLRIAHSAADYRIDVHMKIGVFSEQLQLLIQNLEALLRDIVRRDVID